MSGLADLIIPVANKLWGEPKSRTPNEWRYGEGRTINPRKGVWSDFQNKTGGGVLDLIKIELKVDTRGAFEWLKAQGLYESADNHEARQDSKAAREGKITATYDYVDDTGRMIYQVCRVEDKDLDDAGKPKKRFMQRQPVAGGWQWNLQGIQPTIYRLPDVQEAIAADRTIFIPEGEKLVEMLVADGVPATCNSGGAGKWRPEFADLLAGANVVILEDNDDVGRKHAATVAESLQGKAKSVKRLALPGLPPKGDYEEWKKAGGTIAKLFELVAKTPEAGKEPYVSQFKAIRFCEIDTVGDEHRWLIKDVLAMHEVSLLVGPSQSGKSFVSIDMSMAIARGQSWQGKRVEPGLVVYQAGEGGPGMKKRLRAYREHYGIDKGADLPFVLLPARVDLYSDADVVQRVVKEALHWASQYPESPLRLIVIDTFSKATPAADENSAKDMSMVLERCKQIAEACGCSVQLVHHMNADGSKPRGHTSIFANVDSAVMVERDEVERDVEKRWIRHIGVIKNKDGGDGDKWRFVLQPVDLGKDQYEEPIFSCVCVEPSGEDIQPKPDFSTFTTDMRDTFAMVKKAVFETGEPTPGGLNLPKSIMKVTTLKQVLAYYQRNIAVVSEDADEATRTRVYESSRKSLQRGSADLVERGYVGREGKWMWLTGKEPSARTATAAGRPKGGKPTEKGKPRYSLMPNDIADFH